MAKKLKVYGITSHMSPYNNKRLIIGAYSQKQAAELGNFSLHYFREYAAETGNKTDLSVATEVGVWVILNDWSENPKDYKRLK